MKNELTKEQVFKVKNLVHDVQKELGICYDVPLASSLRSFIEEKGIVICEQKFSKNIDAAITIFDSDNEKMTFIGLNSSLYYDEKLFALAHELFHYLTKSGIAYQDKEDEKIEKMADYFASELLLPSEILYNTIINMDLNNEKIVNVWRYIATLQNKWWLPYRAIVNRLFEEGYLSKQRYDELFNVECRDKEKDYGRLFFNINKETFALLNTITSTNSISNSVINITINNFEDCFISEEEFIETLATFGKKPIDYGFDIQVINDDEEMTDFFIDGK